MESPVKVNVEVQVGEESTKELVKVLTDLLSPASETLGALGDQFRFYRVNSALRAFKKTKDLAEKTGTRLCSPPVKFLVPFIEEASLEEDNSEITDLWAELLFSAGRQYSDYHRSFIGAIKELTPTSAKLLKAMIGNPAQATDRSLSYTTHANSIQSIVVQTDQAIIKSLKRTSSQHTLQDRLKELQTRIYDFQEIGLLVNDMRIENRNQEDSIVLPTKLWLKATNEIPAEDVRTDFRILSRLGLINNALDHQWHKLSGMNDIYFAVAYVAITEYGLRFLESVGLRAKEPKLQSLI